MSQLPAVKISGLTKSYGNKRVLENLDLAVPAGTVLSLLGPNGAGKTTVVEILQACAAAAAAPSPSWGRTPGTPRAPGAPALGVVSQTSADFKDLTVTEAVSHIARFFARPADIAETIDRVGLSDDARTRVSRLSGGRRRRLDVALAIIGRPELLFLDEPTTGFDPEARHVFWDLVKDLRTDGTTVLLTTHYLDEAAQLADEVAIILGGRVIEYGTPEALARQAGSERTVSWIEDGVERTEYTATPTAVVRGLMGRLTGPDGEVPGLQVHTPSLEDHYLELVSRHHST